MCRIWSCEQNKCGVKYTNRECPGASKLNDNVMYALFMYILNIYLSLLIDLPLLHIMLITSSCHSPKWMLLFWLNLPPGCEIRILVSGPHFLSLALPLCGDFNNQFVFWPFQNVCLLREWVMYIVLQLQYIMLFTAFCHSLTHPSSYIGFTIYSSHPFFLLQQATAQLP